jgi:hypothetical protein
MVSLTLTVLSGWVKSMAAREMLVSAVLNTLLGSLMYRIRPCPKYRSWDIGIGIEDRPQFGRVQCKRREKGKRS